MIHHQHFFPVSSDHGKLLPVFLAVLNMEPEKPEVIARNMERVLTARLRDARFFLDADRKKPLGRVRAIGSSTVLFHKKLGSYQEKAARVEKLARVDLRATCSAGRTSPSTRLKPGGCARRTSPPTWCAS